MPQNEDSAAAGVTRPAVVLDTNVLVAAGFRPTSAAGRVAALIRDGALRLVWDDATRRESERIVRRIPPLAGTTVLDLFAPDGRFAGPTDPEAFSFVEDPDDRKFAALAAAAGAALLTVDDHLLRDRERAPVPILTPREFLQQRDR